MPLCLVDYSSSSSDDDEEKKKTSIEIASNKPSSNKLPNPIRIGSPALGDTSESADQDGRIRSFPHERGIWACYIYITCRKTDSMELLRNEISTAIKNSKNLTEIDIFCIEEPHMSLTRTLILRHHWIDEFVRSVQKNLTTSNRFQIYLNSLQIYCNDERTRTFISLNFLEKNSSTQQNLCDIVKRLDRSLIEFNLPPFYKEASFHVSLLWCLGDLQLELEQLLPKFQSCLERLLIAEHSDFLIDVNQLYCKAGNKLFAFRI